MFDSYTSSVRDYYNLLGAVSMCKNLCTIAAKMVVVSFGQRQFSSLLIFFNNIEDLKGKPDRFNNISHLCQMF